MNAAQNKYTATVPEEASEKMSYRDRLKSRRRKTTLKLGTTPATSRMRWRRLMKTAYQWKVTKQH